MQGCPELLQCRGELNRLRQGRRAKPDQNGESAWVSGDTGVRLMWTLNNKQSFISDVIYLTFIKCYYYLSGLHALILFLCYPICFYRYCRSRDERIPFSKEQPCGLYKLQYQKENAGSLRGHCPVQG